jgi:hypothetical protein
MLSLPAYLLQRADKVVSAAKPQKSGDFAQDRSLRGRHLHLQTFTKSL